MDYYTHTSSGRCGLYGCDDDAAECTHENDLSVAIDTDAGGYVYDGVCEVCSISDDGVHVIATVDDSATDDDKAATYSFLKYDALTQP